jgi:hypothetical protein
VVEQFFGEYIWYVIWKELGSREGESETKEGRGREEGGREIRERGGRDNGGRREEKRN